MSREEFLTQRLTERSNDLADAKKMLSAAKAEAAKLISDKAELARSRGRLTNDVSELLGLVQVLLDNDPNDMAADAITVLDVWRKDAERIVAKHKQPAKVES